jgi:DNA invertase Pin-like site-specific DNA recombinase
MFSMAMFSMLSVFAEFERAILVDRVKAGVNCAKAQGKHCGRPPLAPAKAEAMRALLGSGMSLAQIAKKLDVGVGTVHRVKQTVNVNVNPDPAYQQAAGSGPRTTERSNRQPHLPRDP